VTFRKLIGITKSERVLICLLADRDLSGSGVPVEMWGQDVKVAPGPAALAAAAKSCVVPVYVHYERISGERRRVGRSKWGLVLCFGPPLWPDDFPADDRVNALSQAWATYFAQRIRERPEDWHMLQRFGWQS
jgi:KDO2-lipid IV(A) lauroyltransferase